PDHWLILRGSDLPGAGHWSLFRHHRAGQGLSGAHGSDADVCGHYLDGQLCRRRAVFHIGPARAADVGHPLATSASLPAPISLAAADSTSRVLARPPRTYLREVVTRLRRNRTAMVGVVFIVLLIAMAIATPWIAPYDYAAGS